MSLYPTIEDVKDHGVLLSEDLDALEVRYPGIVLRRAEKASAHVDSRLIKRYAAPFLAPYPDKVIEWSAVITSYRLLVDVRGVDPDSPQAVNATARYGEVQAELKEAADAEAGLFELPLRQEAAIATSAVNSGGPLGYSEASPYSWMDVQRERISGGER